MRFPLLVALALALAGCNKPVEEEAPRWPTERLEFTCRDGYMLRDFHQTSAGRLVARGSGYTAIGDSLIHSDDAGATWDRVPLFGRSNGVAVVVDDAVVYEDAWGDNRNLAGPRVLLADGTVVEGTWEAVGASGGEPGYDRLQLRDDLWLIREHSGWLFRSADGVTRDEGLTQGRYVAGEAFGGVFRGQRGIVPGEFVDAEGPQYSQDGGETWSSLNLPFGADVELFGEAGIVTRESDSARAVRVSRDHGQTWEDAGFGAFPVLVGPGEDELWAQALRDFVDFDGHPVLFHSVDGGVEWTGVEVVIDGEVRDQIQVFSVDEVEGQLALVLGSIGDEDAAQADLLCTAGGDGALTTVLQPARDDTPGSLTYWTRGSLVPMPEPEATSTPFPRIPATSAFWDYADEYVTLNRDVDGNLMALFRPELPVDYTQGPPMRVEVVDGTDGSTRIAFEVFDNLLDNGLQVYLDAWDLQQFPDGEFRVNTELGNYRLGGEDGEQVPYPGEGRWGLTTGGVPEYLRASPRFPIGGPFLRYQNQWQHPDCYPSTGEPWDPLCIPGYPDGAVMDSVLHDGRVYAIDGKHGWLVSHDAQGDVGEWRVDVVGLQQPTGLYTALDPNDPGVYLEDMAWFRYVPGDGEPVRRP